uniref:SCP domain-containing protein n=1 Tax=Macrostomum lignano TaxID=282301 RepID=A0A1I8JNT7_9PLAT
AETQAHAVLEPEFSGEVQATEVQQVAGGAEKCLGRGSLAAASLEYTNYTNIPSIGDRIWDVADWAMNSAFFVTTNVVITKNQARPRARRTRTTDGTPHARATRTARRATCTCWAGASRPGAACGAAGEANLTICEIYGWCPTERDQLPLGDD